MCFFGLFRNGNCGSSGLTYSTTSKNSASTKNVSPLSPLSSFVLQGEKKRQEIALLPCQADQTTLVVLHVFGYQEASQALVLRLSFVTSLSRCPQIYISHSLRGRLTCCLELVLMGLLLRRVRFLAHITRVADLTGEGFAVKGVHLVLIVVCY